MIGGLSVRGLPDLHVVVGSAVGDACPGAVLDITTPETVSAVSVPADCA
jgi:hypothetical protein